MFGVRKFDFPKHRKSFFEKTSDVFSKCFFSFFEVGLKSVSASPLDHYYHLQCQVSMITFMKKI